MGGRGAISGSYGGQIKNINNRLRTLDGEIEQRKQWGQQAYDAELKKTNDILANAARKYEYRLNGYHSLIAERTKLKKQLDLLERMKKGKKNDKN